MRQQPNAFDNLVVDVEQVYKEWPIGNLSGGKSVWPGVYRRSWWPLAWKHYLWHIGRRSQLDQSWFERFQPYWSAVLGGRPLSGVQDLYFLRNWYRVKFQQSQVADSTSAGEHLHTWQSPEIIYQLLDQVYKESLVNELPLVGLLREYARGRAGSWLEFGCATAPIATSLFEFGQMRPGVKVYIADIKTLAFHYAAYKFRAVNQVQPVLLEAEDDFHLSLVDKLDVIFCITVFEHLPEPLRTAEVFYEKLKPGGLLIFDYIKGRGEGLDTKKAQQERNKVLDFIGERFEVVRGSLSKGASMEVAVVRKCD